MLLHDFRYALRLIARRPVFAAIAIVTLAVGIGANTAIFTVIDHVVLRAVPFPDPDRLVVVWETNSNLPVPVMVVSPPALHDWRTRNRVFDDIGAFRWRSVTVSGAGEPEQIRAGIVTVSLLRALGVQPQLGRLFLEEEDRPNARRVVLISDGLWRRRFGTSAQLLGRAVSIDGVPHDVVGVMPAGYHAPPPVVFAGGHLPIARSCGFRSRLISPAASAARTTSLWLRGCDQGSRSPRRTAMCSASPQK